MTFLPIVARELKVRSTHAGFHWLRAALAGFAVLACLQWFNFKLVSLSSATVGQESFRMLSWMGFILALGATIVTADCVSQERREGTLGLLFLTTLKSHDVVLGKLAATGLSAIYALLGFAPMLMLPLMTGGVTGGEVMRMTLVLLNVLFVSLATGMWVSVLASTQARAVIGAFATLGFLSLVPLFFEVVARLPFSILSPAYGFFGASDAVYSAGRSRFWLSLGVAHVEGWLLLGAATFGLMRNWRSLHVARALMPAATEARRMVGAPRVILFGRENRRHVFAPVARAVLRMRGQREMAWLAAVISLVGSLWNAVVMNRLNSVWAAASVAMVFTCASSGLFAVVAGRFFFESRRSGELELLLVTPVGARGILREQRLALLRILRGPLYLVVAGAIVAAVGCVYASPGQELGGLLLGLCLVANAVLGILAICRVGMWFGTRVNSPFGIIGCSVGLVEVAPTVLVYLLRLPLFGMAHVFWAMAVPLFFVAKNLFFIWWARERLREEFRADDQIMWDRFFRPPAIPVSSNLPEERPQPAP